MPILNQQHVLTTEDRLRKIQNTDYEAALKNATWDTWIGTLESTGRRERLEWLLSTASIEQLPENTMLFEDLVTQAHEIENVDFGKALKIKANQFKDDQFGFAADWAAGMGAAMALHPQKVGLQLLLAGEGANAKAYDGVPFFSKLHPNNPLDASKGLYENLLTGAASGSYPGALPLIVAGAPSPVNFARALAHVESFKLPNGEARALVAKYVLHPTALKYAARQVTGAKFIGATENVLTNYDVQPIHLPQLNAEPDAYYIVAEGTGQLGKPIIYQTREEFNMSSYDGYTTAQLAKLNELEWIVRGRKAGAYGHPFMIVKVKAT